MSKSEFLERLAAELGALPQSEAEKTVAYYSEIIDDRCEDGMTEAEAVASLEDVKTIASRIICDTPMQVLVKERMRKPRPYITPLVIVLLIIGAPVWLPLLISVVSVVFSVFIALWSVVVSIFAAVFSMGVSGIAAAVVGFASVSGNFARGVFLVGAGLVCIGLAALAFFGAAALARLYVRLIRRAWRGIKRAFVKKEDGK